MMYPEKLKIVGMCALIVSMIVLLVGGCAGSKRSEDTTAAAPQPEPTAAPISDDELSYRNDPLAEAASTPEVSFAAADPGDSELFGRSFENAPPMIPHAVEDLLPITTEDNECLGCHLPEEAADVGATSVPASHLYDIRRGESLTGIAGANYNCTLCHAPQATAPELVPNNFTPEFRSEESKTSSNLLDTLNEGVE